MAGSSEGSAGRADCRLGWLSPATTTRFVLLVAAVLGSALFLFRFIGALNTDLTQASRELTECMEAHVSDRLACVEPAASRNIAWSASGIAIIALGTAIAYLVFPSWIINRYRLLPLRAGVPEVNAHVEKLFADSGLRRTPRVYWNPLNGAVNGLAFGTRRRQCIGLSGGLVAQFYLRQPSFHAILRHEVAHWSLGDVPITYLTDSLWIAFTLFALVPAAVGLTSQSADSVLHIGLRMAVLAAMVFLARTAVLRAREYYADLAAVGEDGTRDAIVEAIRAAAPHPRWRSLLQVHPEPGEREAVL